MTVVIPYWLVSSGPVPCVLAVVMAILILSVMVTAVIAAIVEGVRRC
jgi:hypothetical protein